MSDPFLDKFMEDLIKGAQSTEGFVRGGHVGVEVQRENRGREEKLAGLGGALGGMVGPIGAAAVGGLQDQSGSSAFGSGAGSLIGAPTGAAVGGLGGAGLGAIIARIADKDPAEGAALGAALGIPVGALGGSMLGGHLGQNHMRESKQGALEQRYADGIKAAAAQFGIKEAFLPLLGALAGGTLLRGGLGMAAKGLAGRAGVGGMIGRGAQGALNWAGKGPMRGAALDMAGSMAGGAAGSMLQGGGQ